MSFLKNIAYLYLESGEVFAGQTIGYPKVATGELIFNTSMSGYQEILTDPSYHQQIVLFTYPHIGNTGTTPEDNESAKIYCAGIVVQEMCKVPSNFRSRKSLQDFLYESQTMGIEGVDTRALTQILRDRGCLKTIISPSVLTEAEKNKIFHQMPAMEGAHLVREVSGTKYLGYGPVEGAVFCKMQDLPALEGFVTVPKRAVQFDTFEELLQKGPEIVKNFKGPKIVAVDFGMKWSISYYFIKAGFWVWQVPYTLNAQQTEQLKAAGLIDGLFLSNGPGDPATVTEGIDLVKSCAGKIPIFGICLGHQIIANALGYRTHKMKFGHHGGNQPVYYSNLNKVFITAQNHGFAVDHGIPNKKVPNQVLALGYNLNDESNEVLFYPEQKIFSLQHHPEGGPGPHDERDIFTCFAKLLINFDVTILSERLTAVNKS